MSRPRPALRALMMTTSAALGFVAGGGIARAAEPVVTTFSQPASAAGPIAGLSDGGLWVGVLGGFIPINTAGASTGDLRFLGGSTLPLDVAPGPEGRAWLSQAGATKSTSLLPCCFQQTLAPGGFSSSSSEITDLAPGPDGRMWFVAPTENRVGAASSAGSGASESFVAGAGAAPGTPVAIATGGDGAIWFTKRFPGAIVRMTTAGAVTDTFTAGLPAGAEPFALALGPDGNLWFSDASHDQVGRITPAGGITMFPAVRSHSILAGPDGNLWLAGGSTISPDGAFTPRTLPVDTLTVGPDGNVWGVKLATGLVSRVSLGGQQFANTARNVVPASGASGVADLYPSPITVSGLQGTVTGVTVRLNGLHHRFASDLQVMLVGPGGQSTVLMANVTARGGDPSTPPYSLTGESIAFTAGGRAPARRITSGVFAPIDPGFALSFTPPAPAAPSGGLAQYVGTEPNGTWKLFVVDSEGTAETTGVLAGGWSLDLTTTGAPTPTPTSTPTPTPAATPAPTPTPTATPTPATQADRTAPVLTLAAVPKRAKLAALRKGLTARVTSNENATLIATVAIRRTARGPFSGPLLSRTAALRAGTPLTIRLAPRIAKAPTRSFTARLTFAAVDPAGNRSTISRTVTIRR